MFCSNCGKEIDNNSKFCQYCGAKLQEENVIIANKESTNNVCSICGYVYDKDKKYCPNCTADFIPVEKRTDLHGCGYYSEAKDNSKCKYVFHCKHEECIFVKNYKQYEQRRNIGCYTKIAIIAVILLIMILVSCHNRSNINVQESQVSTQEYTQEKQKNLMKLTNDFVVEGQKNGLVKKIDKDCDNNGCIYIFWLNENIFNQYGYEDREYAKKIFWEYGKLRGESGLIRGYYSGKFL